MSTQPTQLSADDQQVKDFAGKIRAKYPGAYDDMPDFQLSKAIATKHPEYADMLPAGFAAKPSPHSPAGADVRAATPTQFEKDVQKKPEGLLHSAATALGINPEAAWEGIKHPIDTAQNFLSASGEQMLHPINSGLVGQTGRSLAAAAGYNPGATQQGLQRLHQPGALNKIEGGIEYLSSGVPLVGGNLVKAEEQAGQGNTMGSAGTVLGTAAPMLLDPGVRGGAVETLEPVASRVKTIGTAARNVSEHPMARMALQKVPGAVGAVGGGAVGSLLGPGGTAGGAIAGRELLAPLGKKLFPDIVPVDTPGGTGASLPSPNEFYENAGKENMDIMNRTRRQAAVDRADAARADRATKQEAREQESNLKRVDRGEPQRAGTKPVIVTPDQPLPPARMTLQSYPREILAQRAARGDLSALKELQRNPGGVDVSAIPNLRYVGVRPIGR